MNVRPATLADVPLIFSFIQQKADFDRSMGAFAGALHVTEAKLQTTLFGSIPFSYVVFAESSGQAVGFALYGFRYSSFIGQPSIWLDDLYVDTAMRSRGAGTLLMNRLAQISQENQCTHLAWNADDRNTRGLNFYHRLGAEITDQQGHRCFFRWVPH